MIEAIHPALGRPTTTRRDRSGRGLTDATLEQQERPVADGCPLYRRRSTIRSAVVHRTIVAAP
jgi:hypothetical protein